MHVDTGQFAALAEQVRGLRQDLSRVEERIRQLEDDLRDALNRIHVLEDRQPDYADEEPGPEDAAEGGQA